ncbi:MAG: hypothetical protein LIP10_06440 [Clostridiales bacterium]|nr:hypothetical protein [Clostridiales bacterium]
MEKIREYLRKNEGAKTSDIATYLGLSQARTRKIMSDMDDVIAVGANRNKQYKLTDTV